MKSKRFVGLAVAACFSFALLQAAPAADAETVVKGLDNPSGLAVQPGIGDLFIAARDGIHRYNPKSGKTTLEVKWSHTDIYGKGPKYNVGPLGLAFLDGEHLVVGDGARPDGEELVRIFKVGKSASSKTMSEDDAEFTLGPIKASDQTAKGEGNFYGVATNGSVIYVTCNGDDTKGWIAKATFANGKPGKLELAIATKLATETVDAPAAATMSPNGRGLVVAQMGEVNVPGDSLLTVYTPKGKLRRKGATGLSDIVGLAFSPKTKKLYATDFSWVDSTKGGLFLLKPKNDEVTTEKICSLDKPTALAFGADGSLYVAVYGAVPEEGKNTAGSIVRIAPGL
jgi:DNA-binding beta-propeller fold protein YncE